MNSDRLNGNYGSCGKLDQHPLMQQSFNRLYRNYQMHKTCTYQNLSIGSKTRLKINLPYWNGRKRCKESSIKLSESIIDYRNRIRSGEKFLSGEKEQLR